MADEDLSPSKIAAALGWSRAKLYRVFEPLGGVSVHIQTQRLTRLKNSLANPAEKQRVAALSYEAGFTSEHHANRSFRSQFGVPPAEFRRQVQGLTRSAYGDQAAVLKQRMMAWYVDFD